ncbi:MAG: S8 family serine peptidase [Pseudomonadales bacterium]
MALVRMLLWVSVLVPATGWSATLDQWWHQAVANVPTSLGQPVIVAVIDSGLDYHHPDLAPAQIWRNHFDPPNGRDDDGNGYVDDLIGWDFVDQDNNPWDTLGHGTFVTGLIAAQRDNDQGIDGMSNNVQIMTLRVLNSGGYGDPIALTRAFYYAIANGAKVINLSLGQRGISPVDRLLLSYAQAMDVLVVVAAGNAGMLLDDFGPAGTGQALVVAASNPVGQRAPFSNFGRQVGVIAPGERLVSLRARRTDFNLVLQVPGYAAGHGFTGHQAQYYRADGTSFAAPLVAGAAAEIWSRRPELSATELAQLLRQQARDVGRKGTDWESGYGQLHVTDALSANAKHFVRAQIHRVAVSGSSGKPMLEVWGQADAQRFAKAQLAVRPQPTAGAKNRRWQVALKSASRQATEGVLGLISASTFRAHKRWQLQLTVTDRSGAQRVTIFDLNLD